MEWPVYFGVLANQTYRNERKGEKKRGYNMIEEKVESKDNL